jgi:hypothetical protein
LRRLGRHIASLENGVQKVIDSAGDPAHETGRIFGKACYASNQTGGRSQHDIERIR